MCMMCLWFISFVVCFFFFKQKTAYELRISDWSSDVCSSDLRRIGGVGRVHPAAGEAPQQEAVDGAEGELAALGTLARARHGVEIGRASGRERVCQYV